MPRSLLFLLGAAVGGGLLLYAAGVGTRNDPSGFGEPSGGRAVLVLLVQDRESVREVRRAIDPSRVVAESSDALALHGGRIVATGHDPVGRILTTAGWADRPLEIFDAASMRGGPGAREAPPRDAAIAAYARKPTLNYVEALSLLKALDGG